MQGSDYARWSNLTSSQAANSLFLYLALNPATMVQKIRKQSLIGSISIAHISQTRDHATLETHHSGVYGYAKRGVPGPSPRFSSDTHAISIFVDLLLIDT